MTVSIVMGLIGAALPFRSVEKADGQEDMLLKVFCSRLDTSWDDLEPQSCETLKEELASVVIIDAQRDERGRRRATIVKARVPASGKSSGEAYSRTAKPAIHC